jgi:predicted RNA-binding protein with PUA-like domain
VSDRRWLYKSEPDVFSIADLRRETRTTWEGVRNFQARNWLRDAKVGDKVIFYHSNAEPSGAAGVAEVVREAYPDPTQFDGGSHYHDPTSKPEDPRWSMVDVGFVEAFPTVVPLATLKTDPDLEGVEVARKGSRLSVTPLSIAHFDRIVSLGRGR